MKKRLVKLLFVALFWVCLTCNVYAANWTLSGAASVNGSEYQLTNAKHQYGSIIYGNQLNLKKGVTISYKYKMTPSNGGEPYADGINALFMNTSPNGFFREGNYIGMDGQKTTYGVELDNYPYNKNDPCYPHIGIVNTDETNHYRTAPCVYMTDGRWHSVKIQAKKNRITVYHDGVLMLSEKVSMTNRMYFAIVGATGNCACNHYIKNVKVIQSKTVLEDPISINKSYAVIKKKGTVQLKISGAGNTSINWKSSNPGVATVNSAGKVTGKSEGTSTITAKIGNVYQECKVTVLG